MDPSFLKILEQAPWVGLAIYLWKLGAEERREWRAWFEKQQQEITKVIEANTSALSRSTEVLGEANAARFSCPAADPDRFQKRKGNGLLHEEPER